MLVKLLGLGHQEIWVDMPQQQGLDAVNGMLGDLTQQVTQIGRSVNLVQQARADQTVDIGSTLATGIRAGKQIILASEHQWRDRPFRGVVTWHAFRRRPPTAQAIVPIGVSFAHRDRERRKHV
jgi:hypothetical protein